MILLAMVYRSCVSAKRKPSLPQCGKQQNNNAVYTAMLSTQQLLRISEYLEMQLEGSQSFF